MAWPKEIQTEHHQWGREAGLTVHHLKPYCQRHTAPAKVTQL